MSANKALRRLAARIKDLKSITVELECEIERLDGDLSQAQGQIYTERHESSRAIRRAEEAARREREEVSSRDYERQRVARDLERAADWARMTGRDHFGDVDRLTRKLSRGY